MGGACNMYGRCENTYWSDNLSLGTDCSIILKWILRKWDVMLWIGLV
jgi:hypothetical protein